MGATTIFALLGALKTVIQDTPEAVSMFETVEGLFNSGKEPTAAQWAALDAQLTTAHQALQQS